MEDKNGSQYRRFKEGLLNNFSGYVITRNIPECKKFIQDFVKEVVVYKEHIEVIFNVSFSLFKNSGEIEVISKIMRDIVKVFI